ncbi:gluconate 5-dehydrogenase [marine bacterium AO1-C]|nr:gluconate 5-dehydrogenase [marine bacterium AO1-C]
MSSIFSLKDKNVLITGGYGYLGKAICEGLQAEGAKVWVLGRSKEKFEQAFQNTSQVFFEALDISDTQSIKTAFANVHRETTRIDVLINNAFYSQGQNPETMTDDDWATGVDGSLNSVYRCIREIIPYFKKQGHGKIINVSSMYGLVSPDFEVYANNRFLNPPHYGAAKAGVLQMTRYFACYLGKENILVNAVTPGAFPSKEVQKNEDFINDLSAKTPLGRIGKPEELQGAFVFLASDASSYMTGQNIVIDGGWTAW